MEGRLPTLLVLEMTDLAAEVYADVRPTATVFENCVLDRTDLPRTIPEFDTLGVLEPGIEEPPEPVAGVTQFSFVRTERPGQGSLTDESTTGIQLVLISARTRESSAKQALRDWADFVHIRHIAEAAVPGFRMITPYRSYRDGEPDFLHFYEMHTDDPEAAFQTMTPLVAERLGGEDSVAFREWAWHPELRIEYVNTFRRWLPSEP